METKIQFIKGFDEKVLPDVRLTRSRDGSTGTATFRFKNPNILDKSTAKEGEITGRYLIDEEGTIFHEGVNHMPLGRNVNEALRVIDALAHNQKYGEVCPANWNEGDDAMTASSDGVADYLSKH